MNIIKIWSKNFLVACRQLYNPLCWLVGWMVTSQSVDRMVDQVVTLSFFWHLVAFFALLLPPKRLAIFFGQQSQRLISCRTQGEFPSVHLSIRTSIHLFFYSPPPWPSRPQILTLRPDSGPLSPQMSPPGLKSALRASNRLFRPQLLLMPAIFPLRTSGNAPLCPTEHWPFEAAALLSLHYFT